MKIELMIPEQPRISPFPRSNTVAPSPRRDPPMVPDIGVKTDMLLITSIFFYDTGLLPKSENTIKVVAGYQYDDDGPKAVFNKKLKREGHF
jgi:hypothetical protein